MQRFRRPELGLSAPWIASLWLLCACAAAPPPEKPGPLAVPELELALDLMPGSSLSGPGGARPQGADPSAAVGLALHLLVLESLPAGLAPLEPASRLVADLSGARPLLFGTNLTAGGGYAQGPEARELFEALSAGPAADVASLYEGTPLLPGDATLTLAATARERVEDPLDWLDEYEDRGPIPRRVAVAVTEKGGALEVALAVDDLDPVAEDERLARALEQEIVRAAPPGPPEEEPLRRETVVLEVAPAADAPLLLAWPSPFARPRDQRQPQAFALLLEVVPASEGDEGGLAPEVSLALSAAREELSRAAEQHAQRTAPLAGSGFEVLRLEHALETFRGRGGRSSLLLLAGEAGAELTADLALFADEEFLADLSAAAFRGEEAVDVFAAEPGALGWRLERTAWSLLANRAQEEQLGEEGLAALLRHAGALGRFPDVLLDALAASGDVPSFHARLVTEQRFFLDDPDPSARLRAHDWLTARDLAVPGFDPLGDREERRAALRAQEEADDDASVDPASEEAPTR